MNKDNYRRKLVNRNQIAGITTINFEEVAKQQIFESIKNTKLSNVMTLREKYIELKQRMGRTPMLEDYMIQDQLDPIVFFEGSFKHYGDVINKFEKEILHPLTNYENQILTFYSKELLNGKRIDELLITQFLLKVGKMSISEFKNHLLNYDIILTDERLKSIVQVLTLELYQSAAKKNYGDVLIKFEKDHFIWHEKIMPYLDNLSFTTLLEDVVNTGILRFNKYKVPQLKIGEKYSRKDACRLLYWENDESSTMYGYKIKHQTCPIFVTYHKSDDISETTQYQDGFINENLFLWFTRSRRTLASEEVQKIINSQSLEISLHLFIKKEDGEGTDFYYLGEVNYQDNSAIQTKMPNSNEDVVTMHFELEQQVPYSLYHYLVKNE